MTRTFSGWLIVRVPVPEPSGLKVTWPVAAAVGWMEIQNLARLRPTGLNQALPSLGVMVEETAKVLASTLVTSVVWKTMSWFWEARWVVMVPVCFSVRVAALAPGENATAEATAATAPAPMSAARGPVEMRDAMRGTPSL